MAIYCCTDNRAAPGSEQQIGRTGRVAMAIYCCTDNPGVSTQRENRDGDLLLHCPSE
jgi:hypothetical protein